MITNKKQKNSQPTQPRPSHRKKAWSPQDTWAVVTLALTSVGLIVVLFMSIGSNQSLAVLPSPPSQPPMPSNQYRSDEPKPNSPAPLKQVEPSASSSALFTKKIETVSKPSMLRFADDAARRIFMDTNQLSEDEITYIPGLNIYTVHSSSPLLTSGSQLMPSTTYRALLTPTDPSYSSQWYLPAIAAPQAWNTQTGSATTITAVVDTGFAVQHQDLANKWSRNTNEIGPTTSEGPEPNCSSRQLALNKNCNNIDDDGDGYVDNYLGWNFNASTNNVMAGQVNTSSSGVTHGTIVSGLIGAQPNNSFGISGENWSTKIMPVQALDDTGSGDTLSVSLAVRYAVDHGANVINLSLGSSVGDTVLAEQVQYAIDHGVSIVAAAGNDGCDCVLYPARYPGVIAVGATTSSNTRASFSSYGAALTLVAPGANICSTVWTAGNTTSAYGCGYNGTSFSSPLVAGAVGILIAQNRSLTPGQIKSALITGANKLAAMNGQNRNDSYGAGLLNVAQGLQQVSLPTPAGAPLNVHTVSQAAPQGSRQKDSLNTTCITTELNSCQIRAINLATNEVVTLSDAPSLTSINLYWNTSVSQLSVGTWTVQVYAVTSTSNSLVREETLTINP